MKSQYETSNKVCLEQKISIEPLVNFSKDFSLVLKLDTQPRSHLVGEVCIRHGLCSAPHPLQAYDLFIARNGG